MRHTRVIGLLAIILVAAGGAFTWRWKQRGPDRPSVAGAIGRFRTSSTVASQAPSSAPKAGVYVYEGTGSESLSFLATKQLQGPTEPGTVTIQPNGCWQFRIDFNSFHHQSWNRCAKDGKLLESGNTADQRFDFVSFKMGEHSVTTCNPPVVVADFGATPGTKSSVRCTGRSKTTKTTFTQTGVAVFVGRETVEVGKVRVPAVHTREELTLTGGQTGNSTVDIWFAVSDGLPLKESHIIKVVSPAPAPLKHVTYTERGGWQLTSTTPQT